MLQQRACACPGQISVIVPVFNEEETIPLLLESLRAVLDQLSRRYEIILVNDGSTDASSQRLAEAASHHAAIKVIEFRRNSGQTAALMAGIDHASGHRPQTEAAEHINRVGQMA